MHREQGLAIIAAVVILCAGFGSSLGYMLDAWFTSHNAAMIEFREKVEEMK